MFIRKKKNPSGTTSVVIVDKSDGFKCLHTVGVSANPEEIDRLVLQGKKWIDNYSGQMALDFNQVELSKKAAQDFIKQIDNVLLNGTQLILNRVFDNIGFNQINDDVLRALVISRITFPSSKSATSAYLKTYFDEDLNLNKIYRYLDKLNSTKQDEVQQISVNHTKKILGGVINVVFYDVTTLYFETDDTDELRKPGYSKDGKHSNPQIVLGLLVSAGGYPLAYTIHEGNKYEGHTMLPVVRAFVDKYQLTDFVVVADAGLLNKANIEELEKLNYKYIIGARIKNLPEKVKSEILAKEKRDDTFNTIELNSQQRLVVGYSLARAKNNSYNRSKGVKRLEKLFSNGKVKKEHVNRRGYNKFFEVANDVEITINYDKIDQDANWDGLKGYITNTHLDSRQIYEAYHNLWQIEKAFRISKSTLDMRPIFHFTKRRIEAHICICFVALKVYKELERLLKEKGIPISVDKVIELSKTVVTLNIKLTDSHERLTQTIILPKHKIIAPLFDESFWVPQ